jgi:hypothetical protein
MEWVQMDCNVAMLFFGFCEAHPYGMGPSKFSLKREVFRLYSLEGI